MTSSPGQSRRRKKKNNIGGGVIRYRSERAGLETVRRRQANTEKRIGMAGWTCGFDIVMLGWAERRTDSVGMGVYIRIIHETRRSSSGRGEPPPGPQGAVFGGGCRVQSAPLCPSPSVMQDVCLIKVLLSTRKKNFRRQKQAVFGSWQGNRAVWPVGSGQCGQGPAGGAQSVADFLSPANKVDPAFRLVRTRPPSFFEREVERVERLSLDSRGKRQDGVQSSPS